MRVRVREREVRSKKLPFLPLRGVSCFHDDDVRLSKVCSSSPPPVTNDVPFIPFRSKLAFEFLPAAKQSDDLSIGKKRVKGFDV